MATGIQLTGRPLNRDNKFCHFFNSPSGCKNDGKCPIMLVWSWWVSVHSDHTVCHRRGHWFDFPFVLSVSFLVSVICFVWLCSDACKYEHSQAEVKPQRQFRSTRGAAPHNPKTSGSRGLSIHPFIKRPQTCQFFNSEKGCVKGKTQTIDNRQQTTDNLHTLFNMHWCCQIWRQVWYGYRFPLLFAQWYWTIHKSALCVY